MGGHECWVQPNGFFPNGLLPNEAASVTRVLDPERWSLAEERTADLISHIQPNQPSEERREAVACYVQRLIAKCFSCRVVTFGSVPLKTYLPDGDIDLTTFSDTQNLTDSWANEVRDVLESEEKSEDAEFRVKEVQYIQAEVKIIKCLVENIVVDISFNQLGGLCTLCFLEEVDQLINQNHLFKRSIILIKAWCYYESRILGAHHGLISTYALETLVLYIFHVFNNSFAGPLEVLYRFLEFFSKFDWDNFCVSLWGPVAIKSLPDMRADPPRKDSGELLLSKLFLNACSSVYAVSPGGQESQEQPFISKHFNVIDPLRKNNNLGRSVSKGNFFRIRSAFSFGAQRLARLLECPKGNIIAEVNQFFMNTWDRHGKGHRADAPSPDLHGLQPVNFNQIDGSDSLKNHSGRKKVKEDGVSSQHGNYSSKRVSRSGNVSVVSRGQSQKTYANLTSSMPSDQNHQIPQCISSNGNTVADKGRNSRPDYFQNEVHGRYQVARTHSSPELTETSSEIPSRGRHNRASETGKGQTTAKLENNRRRNLGSEVAEKHNGRFSFEESPSSRQSSSQRSIDAAFDLNNASNSCYVEFGSGGMGEDNRFVAETMQMRQEEQDLVNMMASSRFHSFNGHVQMPVNLSSAHSPLPVPPSILGSLGYAHRNSACLVPTSTPSFDSPWSSNIHHSQGLISLPVSQYFPSIGMASNREEMAEPVDDNLVSAELNQEDVKHGFWSDQDTHSVRGYDRYNQSYEGQLEERQQFASASNFGHSSRGSSSDSYSPKDHGLNKKNRGCIRENYGDNSQHQTTKESDAYSTASSRFIPSSQATSRIIPSTEKVWESKLARDRQGRKEAPSTDSSDVYVLGKNRWQFDYASVDHASSQADDDDREWIPLSTATTDTTECIGSGVAASSLVRTHHPHGYEHSEVSGSNSMLPVAPVLVGSGSRERAIDNNGVLPFAFYPTGPPVPFLTMLPVYNFPNEMETSSASTNHFEGDEELDNCCVSHSDLSLDSTENLDQSEIFDKSNIMKTAAAVESSEERKPDILNSDFMSHWHNLLYGRFCQNARHNGPLLNPSSAVVVPPMHLHGNFPLDVPGRPPANMNLFTQLMSYSPRLIPVMPLQPGSNRAAGVYQHYADEIPRYRGGTGTYLPNPISFRDRHSSNTRNHRGNYSYDRKDRHGDREGTWNINSKSRYASRGQGRNQVDKSSLRMERTTANNSQSDKTWDSLKDDSLPSYGSFSSSNAMTHDSAKAAYGMYPLPVMNPSGVNSSGASLPSVVMLYPYDQNMDYGSPAEQLEFGSLGPVHYTGINEVSHLGGGSSRSVKEQRNYLGDSVHSSPDQPSSPNLQR